MTRVTTTIFVFMILLNGSISVMSASGLSEDLGVELASGVSENIKETVDTVSSAFDPSRGLGSTLFTLFISAGVVLELIASMVVALPDMLITLGLPEFIVVPLALPLYAVSSLEIIYAVTGRDLV